MTTAQIGAAPTNDLDKVRRHVRTVLENTLAFRQLPDKDRAEIASNAVTVLRYLSDPAAGQPELAPVAKALEGNQAPNPAFANRPAQQGNDEEGGAGKFLQGNQLGGAAQAAPGVMSGLVATVDFPKFVSGLIEGVFTSIVNSSIRQMHEFGKFLEGVVKSVEDFAQDHIQPAQARQYLQNKFPGALNMDNGRLVPGDTGDQPPPDFQALLGMVDKPDLDSEDGEQKLVLAAQLKMARMRQQELSQLVLMGINRIVVTEGEIKASVLFDVTAKDSSSRTADNSKDFSDSMRNKQHQQEGGGWFSDPDKTSDDTRTTVSTQHTHVEGKTSDEINAHAKLTGSVTVKFKSETFPLERLASSAEVANINDKSKR